MRKRINPSILEKAIAAVTGFENVLRKLDEQIALRGHSKSTLQNYSRRIALLVKAHSFDSLIIIVLLLLLPDL